MNRSLYIAATGMRAQQTNIDVISNNLANVNTTGFKRSRADFQDMLYQSLQIAGSNETASTEIPTGSQVGLGTRLVAIQKLFTQGSYQTTGEEKDLAIDGNGFFQVTMPDGDIGYTRAGSWKLDSTGQFVTSDGNPLTPSITIPADTTQITIGQDGTVSVTISGQDPQIVGNIQLAHFANPSGLQSTGDNLYKETVSSGSPTTGTPGQSGLGTVSQGFLELSNVDVVEELVNMIVGQRAYEINSKAIQTSDEMLQAANQLKR